MTVSKSAFKKLMTRIAKKNEQKMLEFGRSIPYLKNLPSYLVNKLQYHLELVSYDRRDVVIL